MDFSKPLENEKYEQFAQHYSVHFHKTNAALAAGYSEATAGLSGFNAYNLPEVRGRIKWLLKSRRVEYALTTERIIEELSRVAFSDAVEILQTILETQTVSMEDLQRLPKRITAAIRSVKMGKYGIEVQFYDKLEAIEKLGKHLGFYEKDNEQKKPVGPMLYIPDNGRGALPPNSEL